MSLAMEWLRRRPSEDPMNYLDDVYRYAAARLERREDAEDIAIEVVQALPNPCRKQNLRLYMIGMARRKIATLLRKSGREMVSFQDEPSETFESSSERAVLVAQVMKRLTSEHQEALTLKYIVGMSSAEIGDLLGKRSDAIDSILQRAREAFAREWTALLIEEVNP